MILFAATSTVISLPRRKQLIYHLPMKVREILKLLEDDGWYLARTKGSHQQFKHQASLGLLPSLENPALIYRPALYVVS
jgi:hypothetical protein